MPGNMSQRAGTPKSHADVTRFLKGADPALVSEMLGHLPPCFFIVGAPRCGTTALGKALGGHPRISFSKPKETHFFTQDLSGMSVEEIRRTYLERFQPNLSRDTLAIGDGSVSYLYSPEAIHRAMAFDPGAKFIVSVRSPVHMLRSYHARLLFLMDEDEPDFQQAWALQEERLAGRRIPPRCREPRLLQYGDAARLGHYVRQLFEVAGRERCHVVVFDDLAADPAAVYREVLDFIGVEFDGRTEFKQKRGNAQFKSKWLQQLTMNPPRWVFNLVNSANPETIKRLKRLRKRVKRYNTAPVEGSPLHHRTVEALQAYFRSDVEHLSALLGRDLTHWVTARQPDGRPADDAAANAGVGPS